MQSGVRAHILMNIVGLSFPLLTALLTIPLFVHDLGPVRYGYFIATITFLGYGSFFDLGMAKAVTQRLAASTDLSKTDSQEVIWTGVAVSLVLGFVGGVGIWIIVLILYNYGMFSHNYLSAELKNSLVLMPLILPMSLTSSLALGILQANCVMSLVIRR